MLNHDHTVWLEPQGGVYMGVCIGTGRNVDEALADAKACLEAALKKLNEV